MTRKNYFGVNYVDYILCKYSEKYGKYNLTKPLFEYDRISGSKNYYGETINDNVENEQIERFYNFIHNIMNEKDDYFVKILDKTFDDYTEWRGKYNYNENGKAYLENRVEIIMLTLNDVLFNYKRAYEHYNNKQKLNIEQLKEFKQRFNIKNNEEKTFENTILENKDETFRVAFNRINKYNEIFDNKILRENKYDSIYLFGTPGVGKTHLMDCLINSLEYNMNTTLRLTVNELNKILVSTFNNNDISSSYIINVLQKVDLLVIDDIGTESGTKSNGEETWLQEQLFEVINNRYEKQKPTCFTSNLSVRELMNKGYNPKIVDRIIDLCGGAIMEIKGVSHRLEHAQRELDF